MCVCVCLCETGRALSAAPVDFLTRPHPHPHCCAMRTEMFAPRSHRRSIYVVTLFFLSLAAMVAAMVWIGRRLETHTFSGAPDVPVATPLVLSTLQQQVWCPPAVAVAPPALVSPQQPLPPLPPSSADAQSSQRDLSTACEAALASPMVHLVSPSGQTSLPWRIWSRLGPCLDTLRGAVYVYNDEELGRSPPLSMFPLSREPAEPWLAKYDQYSTDQHIVHLLRASEMLTTNPAAARLFIIPQYATHETHFCAFNLRDPAVGTDIVTCAENVSATYLQGIANSLVTSSPWFKRYNGGDHLLVFPWDYGHHFFSRTSWNLDAWLQPTDVILVQYLHSNPQRADRTVVMPVPQTAPLQPAAIMRNVLMQGPPLGLVLPGVTVPDFDTTARAGPPSGACGVRATRWLATFRGTVWPGRSYSGGIRQDLLARYANSSEEGILFSAGHTTPEAYAAELSNTLFCLSPPGSSAWSQRIYDLVAAGCPIVFFDSPTLGSPRLAYPRIVPWEDFSITIPAGAHLDVARILAEVPMERVCAMRRAISAAAPFLLWSMAPTNVLSLIMADALGISQASLKRH